MLSKKEREYLSKPDRISRSYGRVLRHRIRKKLIEFYKVEQGLLEDSGITEFNNAITENNNGIDNLRGNCRTHKISLSFPPI